ncbi:hypothetical protein SOVF_129320 [Spinacia oleracea]|nr:hypothetical protein SOVF_129320 [Spinacia oleracea]
MEFHKNCSPLHIIDILSLGISNPFNSKNLHQGKKPIE